MYVEAEGWAKYVLQPYFVRLIVVFVSQCFQHSQEGAGQRSEGLQFSLANKFTSESLSVRAEEDARPPAGGVDPSSRPAGLTLRTPATPGTSTSSSSAPAGKSRGTDTGQTPVRSTLDWTPAPLLCKRLNVPVPRASSAKDWAAKDGSQIGRGSTAAAVEQGILGLSRFVPDSSASNRPKVWRFLLFPCTLSFTTVDVLFVS